MLRRGSIARSVAFIGGSVRNLVSPLRDHMESLGMPNMRLQPHIGSLPSVVFLKQVPRLPPILPRRPLLPLREPTFGILRDVCLAKLSRKSLGIVTHGSSSHMKGQRLVHQFSLLLGVCDGQEETFQFVYSRLVELDRIDFHRKLNRAPEGSIVL